MTDTTLNVKGMSCDHCKMTVEKAVKALDGVSKVNVDLEAKTVTVGYDEGRVGPARFRDAIEEKGYTVEV